ncbi:GNAT family N-acetyltransferase [Oceanobacillus jeddahense]|uniref:GNAT family N-acetyltransferase n=1 Tax=Oceanobacillus jeddahense TaxID=1462527 RepID=UPI000595C1BA|nr:GNAT family N-acetyltransferase [Oceanobacillus jeddahense]
MIELRKITEDNIDEVIALEVRENQKDFMMTSNLRCIADAYVLNENGEPAIPLAIYADGVVVGFLMYTYDTLDHESFENEGFYRKKGYFVWHIMIDERYQGKRYGKLAFEKMLMDMEAMPYGEADYVALFYHLSNLTAKTLYALFGFTEPGIIQDKSIMAIKNLDKK